MKYKNPRLKHVKKIKRACESYQRFETISFDVDTVLNQCNLLLETKKAKKRKKLCEHLKKREAIYLRSYCEAGCDCQTCHNGNHTTEVERCMYCQLKWKNKGQYNPKFWKKHPNCKPKTELTPIKHDCGVVGCRGCYYAGQAKSL